IFVANMLYSSIFLAASALSGLAAAQVQTGNYTIDPNSVEATTRAAWCRSEFNTCNTLCANSYKTNSCDQNALTYVCTCNNGQSPDMSKYDGSLSTFICNQYKGQCLATNAGNATAQDQCSDITCGGETAASIVTSSAASSSSSAAASSGSSAAASATSAVASGASSASASAASASSTGAASAITVGNGALVASLFGLFAYAL
ncbi:unnamed protein product, partial [Aureobasidium pullulans]